MWGTRKSASSVANCIKGEKFSFTIIPTGVREKEWGKDFLKRLGKANVDIAPGTHLARNGRQSLLDYARFD